MDKKLIAFFIANGCSAVDCLVLIFLDWWTLALAVLSFVAVLFGVAGYICVNEMVILVYVCFAGLLSFGGVVLAGIHILENDWWYIPFDLLIIPGFVVGIICAALYYREIKYDHMPY